MLRMLLGNFISLTFVSILFCVYSQCLVVIIYIYHVLVNKDYQIILTVIKTAQGACS